MFNLTVKEEKRQSSDKKFFITREKCIILLSDSLFTLNIEDSDMQLDNNDDITIRVEDIQTRLKTYDLIHVLYLLKVDQQDKNTLILVQIILSMTFRIYQSILFELLFDNSNVLVKTIPYKNQSDLRRFSCQCVNNTTGLKLQRTSSSFQRVKRKDQSFYSSLSEVVIMERRVKDISLKDFKVKTSLLLFLNFTLSFIVYLCLINYLQILPNICFIPFKSLLFLILTTYLE